MGWVWKDEPSDVFSSSAGSGDISEFQSPNLRSEDRCSTRKIVKSQCKTEEVEPGKFVRKCEKIEQVLKECAGRPSEVVESSKEYTEDDVTDEMKNGSFSFGSSEAGPFNFPGLRSDIDSIDRSFFGSFGRLFEAAEEMKNGLFGVFEDLGKGSSFPSSSIKRGVPIEDRSQKGASPKPEGNVDLAGLAREV